MNGAELHELKVLLRKAMQEQRRERTQCAGKQRFNNRVDAARAMRSRRLKDVCTVYRCGFCGYWHVGSQTEERKKRKALRLVRERKEARCE